MSRNFSFNPDAAAKFVSGSNNNNMDVDPQNVAIPKDLEEVSKLPACALILAQCASFGLKPVHAMRLLEAFERSEQVKEFCALVSGQLRNEVAWKATEPEINAAFALHPSVLSEAAKLKIGRMIWISPFNIAAYVQSHPLVANAGWRIEKDELVFMVRCAGQSLDLNFNSNEELFEQSRPIFKASDEYMKHKINAPKSSPVLISASMIMANTYTPETTNGVISFKPLRGASYFGKTFEDTFEAIKRIEELAVQTAKALSTSQCLYEPKPGDELNWWYHHLNKVFEERIELLGGWEKYMEFVRKLESSACLEFEQSKTPGQWERRAYNMYDGVWGNPSQDPEFLPMKKTLDDTRLVRDTYAITNTYTHDQMMSVPFIHTAESKWGDVNRVALILDYLFDKFINQQVVESVLLFGGGTERINAILRENVGLDKNFDTWKSKIEFISILNTNPKIERNVKYLTFAEFRAKQDTERKADAAFFFDLQYFSESIYGAKGQQETESRSIEVLGLAPLWKEVYFGMTHSPAYNFVEGLKNFHHAGYDFSTYHHPRLHNVYMYIRCVKVCEARTPRAPETIKGFKEAFFNFCADLVRYSDQTKMANIWRNTFMYFGVSSFKKTGGFLVEKPWKKLHVALAYSYQYSLIRKHEKMLTGMKRNVFSDSDLYRMTPAQIEEIRNVAETPKEAPTKEVHMGEAPKKPVTRQADKKPKY